MNSYYLTSFKPLFRSLPFAQNPYKLSNCIRQSFVSKGEPLRVWDVYFSAKGEMATFHSMKEISFSERNKISVLLLAFYFSQLIYSFSIYMKRNTVVFPSLVSFPVLCSFQIFELAFISKPVSYLYIGLYLSFSFVTFSIAALQRLCNWQNSRSVLALFVQNIELFLQFFQRYLQRG